MFLTLFNRGATMIPMIRAGLMLFLGFVLIAAVGYPCLIGILDHLFFKQQAYGSMMEDQNILVGSKLIGQDFQDPKNFWGRPSSTGPYPYNPLASRASNQALSAASYVHLLEQRIATFKQTHPRNTGPVPIDLITSSASGLDPDISLEAALYQLPRIAEARKLSIQRVESVIYSCYQERVAYLLGQPRVNVLCLNIKLKSQV